MEAPGVVIVGGGVIGLSAAYALAREGVRSVVLDRRELGREASWAGAGIIAPGAELPTDDPAVALRTLSTRMHAEWAEALREETGLDNGFRRCGGLDVAWTSGEEAELAKNEAAWTAEGIAFERLGPGEIAGTEPDLNQEIRCAWSIPGRAQLRNPRHLRALAFACERRGVVLRPGVPAEGFRGRGGRVTAVETPLGAIACERVVIAAGPWSGPLLAMLGAEVATPPVKGEIVLLRCERPVLGRIVEWGRNYLVPREDGRVLVGATEEEVGFDTRSTPGAIHGLLGLALRLCPALGGAEVERAWAGLRPGSPDGQPLIGRPPGAENVVVAAGHRRAGLQLSTGTAALIADLVLGRPPRIDPGPFRLDRTAAEVRPGPFRS